MIHQDINNCIEQASKVIGKTWPLYSFVTSNPLSGYENKPFQEAVAHAESYLGTHVFPKTEVFKVAWEQRNIDKTILIDLLKQNQLDESPEDYLKELSSVEESGFNLNLNNELDRMMSKWLANFMDEGLAEWNMPFKDEGFYKAWRQLAIYDGQLPKTSLSEIPESASEFLGTFAKQYSEEQLIEIFKHHLGALPGWTAYINYRTQYSSSWQEAYPINLLDYLAVRLWIANKIDATISPAKEFKSNSQILKLQYIWLKAWEKSWQNELKGLLNKQQINVLNPKNDINIPEAQMVFCIDTRSELIRRHIEGKGNYETFGYAGFFGIAMDYENLEDGYVRKSCPPILDSAYHVSEISQQGQSVNAHNFRNKIEIGKFKAYFLRRLKNMLPSAFGFVEGSGLFYGISLVMRTLTPSFKFRSKNAKDSNLESIFTPHLEKACTHNNAASDIPIEEKAAIVKSGFDLMGWKNFAPIVLFVGHGSQSANNPFGSSLDCGACAASPGRHNARMLAKFANNEEVRLLLRELHGITIPSSTVFIGAEHNTTTDEILLFDSEVSEFQKKSIQKLKEVLKEAQKTATQERLGINEGSIQVANKKANNWGETRPEWGLAKNAGFVVGPRELTKDSNLDGRCFLHSYDWQQDANGKALEGIMQGPMVVTQWINNHYYFSSVSDTTLGSGSKITHNVTGNFGVVQGNGGDLKMGLPLQSLMSSDTENYHQPLRLSVLIQAPLARVSDIVLRNDHIKQLLDNEWIYLLVMDPVDNNNIYKYGNDLNWIIDQAEVNNDQSIKNFGDKRLKEELV